MSVAREKRRRENEVIRENASMWRDEPPPLGRKIKRRTGDIQNRNNESFLSSLNKKITRKKPEEVHWDEEGRLIKFHPEEFQVVKKSSRRSNSVSIRNANTANNNNNDNEKPDFVSRIGKIHYEYEKNQADDDEMIECTTNRKPTKEEQRDSSIRLSTLKKSKRQRSIQPKKSTDFTSFIERQQHYVKVRCMKMQPPPEYKIEMSEGTKRFMNDENYRKHSVTDCIEQKRDQFRVKREEVQPKINKKKNFRMANMDYAEEKKMKEVKKNILRVQNDVDMGLFKLPEKRRRRTRDLSELEKANDPKLRNDSIYAERSRIQDKIKEMEPIFDAEVEEMKRINEYDKSKKKKYVPNYIQEICDTIGYDPTKRFSEKNRTLYGKLK